MLVEKTVIVELCESLPSSCLPRICTVFYSIGEVYIFGLGQSRFIGKELAGGGMCWCCGVFIIMFEVSVPF